MSLSKKLFFLANFLFLGFMFLWLGASLLFNTVADNTGTRSYKNHSPSDQWIKEYQIAKYLNSQKINKIVNTNDTKTDLSDEQLICMAKNIYHEARDQGITGMLLVGHVTMNRVESSQFPDTICNVVYQSKQFSWVHTKKDHRAHETEFWNISLDIANRVMNRTWDRSQGALYFYNPDLVSPGWARKMQVTVTENDHVFLTPL